MRHLQTEILVIGGGATGTGVLRDLAMRGFKCVLVERRDLAYGTTGRYHGLLHSGARYVVKDPEAARECFEENQILRRIMPQCIEDTGGFFVLTPHDDPDYAVLFQSGCQKAGIPFENISISRMLKQEPLLDPHILQCFRVPDASADSFLAANLNKLSACQHGAQVLTYHEVTQLIVSQQPGSAMTIVEGAVCQDLVKDEEVEIRADLVVNAAGAWAGKIANWAGIELSMIPGKGTMLALNQRMVNTIINRCKLPSDGDILVPAHSVAVIGTTDIRVTDPDHYGIEPWEIRLMLDEGEKLIPQFKQFRVLRAWAGVRPLLKSTDNLQDRDISRAFVLLDHAERDGVNGLVTITSGKWTTYRKMAQVTTDKVCEKLNVDRPCRTYLEPLPLENHGHARHHYLGTRLEEIEHNDAFGQLLCECELVTHQEVLRAITMSSVVTLDDVRRITRLGMGPCQGAYCAFRAAGILHSIRHPMVQDTNVALKDFLQERWKGNLPVISGQQLRQARFNELLYVDVLNAPCLAGEQESKLAAEPYSKLETAELHPKPAGPKPQVVSNKVTQLEPYDLVVIGAGFSGLFTAWQACERGLKTKVITQGWGTPYWSSGCIDILGYLPPAYSERVTSPDSSLESLIISNPNHPYSLTGLPNLAHAIQTFIQLSKDAGMPYAGRLDVNWSFPTALGTLRPTCLAPDMMISGDVSLKTPMLIVGFNQYQDFHPSWLADNLSIQGILASDVTLDLTTLQKRKFVTALVLARLFDEPEFRQEVIDSLKPKVGNFSRIGFPAVLGLQNASGVKKELEDELGVAVFEIPGLPPSGPGIRLQNLLINAIENRGGAVFNGMEVAGFSVSGKKIVEVLSKSPSRLVSHPAQAYVLATGGILGGGLRIENNGYAQESIFNLPIDLIAQPHIFQDKFLSLAGHPIFRSGVKVDANFQPVDCAQGCIFDNLYVVGSALADCDPVRERSISGIALATGSAVADYLSERLHK